MTAKEVLYKVCNYATIDEMEFNDDITIGEVLEAMEQYAKADAEERYKEAMEYLETLISSPHYDGTINIEVVKKAICIATGKEYDYGHKPKEEQK